MADRSIGFNIIARDSASAVLGKVSKSIAGVGGATTNLSKGSSGLSSVRDKLSSLSAPALRFAGDAVGAFKSVAAETMGLRKVMGGTVEDVSRFRGAAQLAGVGSDVLQVGMTKLAKAVGSNSPVFAKLGIAVKDAHGKAVPMKDLLPQIEDKFKSMPNGAQKTALAMQLFGKGGAALIPMLSKGSSGVAELEKKSDKLGLTLRGPALDALTKNNLAMREQQAAIQGAKVQLGAALMPVLASFASIISSKVVPAVSSVTNFMGKHKAITMTVAGVLAGLVITMKAVTFATNAWAAASKVASAATKIWAAMQWVWNAAMSANPIGIVIVVVAAVVAALVIFRGKWGAIWSAVVGALKAAGSAIWSAIKAVGTYLEWPVKFLINLELKWLGLWLKIGLAVLGAAKSVGKAILSVAGWVIGLPGRVIGALAKFELAVATAALRAFVAAVKWVSSGVANIAKWIAGLAGKVIGSLARFEFAVASAALRAFVAAVKWVANGIANVVRYIAGLWGRVTGALGNFERGVAGAAARALSSFVGRVANGLDTIVRYFIGLPGRIGRAVGNLGGLLFGAGRNVIEGLWNGIQSLGGWIAGAVGNLVKSIIPGPIRHVLGIASPSKVTAQLGRFAGQGLAIGMHASAGEVEGASRRLANAATAGMGGLGSVVPVALGGGRTSPTSVAAAGAGGGGVHVHLHGNVYGGPAGVDELAMKVRSALLARGASAGLKIGLA